MVTGLNHVFFLDHELVYDFYVNKLRFEVRADATFRERNRWLTVGPNSQPDLEIVLAFPRGR